MRQEYDAEQARLAIHIIEQTCLVNRICMVARTIDDLIELRTNRNGLRLDIGNGKSYADSIEEVMSYLKDGDALIDGIFDGIKVTKVIFANSKCGKWFQEIDNGQGLMNVIKSQKIAKKLIKQFPEIKGTPIVGFEENLRQFISLVEEREIFNSCPKKYPSKKQQSL